MKAKAEFHDPYDRMDDEQFDAYAAELLARPQSTVPISLRLPVALLARVKSVAREMGTPYQTLVKRMIEVGTTTLERQTSGDRSGAATGARRPAHVTDLETERGRKGRGPAPRTESAPGPRG